MRAILAEFAIGGQEKMIIFLVIMVDLVVLLLGVALLVYIVRRLEGKNSVPLPQPSPLKPVPPSPPPPVATQTQVMGRKCPQCGAELKADAPEGLCPACLLQRGIATEGGAPAGRTPFVPPPVAELAGLFPQLEIVEFLGRGGMGAVYKARQPRLDRMVALKILSPEKQNDAQFAERFGREARALARLHHPNIVMVHDFGEVQGRFYLLMEYVDGLTLRQVLQAGKISPAEALKIVPKICEALQYAHEQGIVHRDIKPENILVDKQGRVKIADFGIAKIAGLETKDRSLTGARDVMGTPHYMAPEQVEQPQAVDHRADIYSLGVVFYEMLTGELPLGKFAVPSQKAQMDVRLDEVVMHALEKEPARRYQQASEVKTAVETIASKPAGPEGQSAPPPFQPGTARTGSDKAILPAFLLSTFFGVFGAHRFYAGKILTACLQLCAAAWCVVLIIACATAREALEPVLGILLGFSILGCMVWAVIDWILILCKAFTDGRGQRINCWIHAEGGRANANINGGGSNAGSIPASPTNDVMVTMPAVALMVLGAWKLLSAFVSITALHLGVGLLRHWLGTSGILGIRGQMDFLNITLCLMIPALVILYGGYHMLERRCYAWALAAAIVSIVLLTPLGFIIGIWAVIVLARVDVRSTFGGNSCGVTASGGGSRGVVTGIILALIILGGISLLAMECLPFIGPETSGDSSQTNNGKLSSPDHELSPEELAQAGIREENGRYTKDFDRTIPLNADGGFKVEGVNGSIQVRGWSSNAVCVHASIHSRSSQNVADVQIIINSQPDAADVHEELPSKNDRTSSFWQWLFYHVNNRDSATVDYVIHVPEHAKLEKVRSVNGNVDIKGALSDIEASTVNGAIEIKDAAADLNLATVNGRIIAQMTALGRNQQVSLDTVNGQIELTLPENADASFSASTVNGGISSDFPALQPTKEFPLGNKLKGSLGNGSASVKATTVNGGMRFMRGAR